MGRHGGAKSRQPGATWGGGFLLPMGCFGADLGRKHVFIVHYIIKPGAILCNRRFGLKTRQKHTLFACIVLLHVVKYMFYNVKALC